MREKIYDFEILQPLTAERRKAIGDLIDGNASSSPWPISYEWSESKTILHLTATPLRLDIEFHPKTIEVFGSAPFWARMFFTQQKRLEGRKMAEKYLKELGFMTRAKPSRAKSAGKIASGSEPETG